MLMDELGYSRIHRSSDIDKSCLLIYIIFLGHVKSIAYKSLYYVIIGRFTSEPFWMFS